MTFDFSYHTAEREVDYQILRLPAPQRKDSANGSKAARQKRKRASLLLK
jgi:hypothetical protein